MAIRVVEAERAASAGLPIGRPDRVRPKPFRPAGYSDWSAGCRGSHRENACDCRTTGTELRQTAAGRINALW